MKPLPHAATWGARTVWTIANNPAYIGIRRWREGTEYLAEGAYEPIIDSSTFRSGQSAASGWPAE